MSFGRESYRESGGLVVIDLVPEAAATCDILKNMQSLHICQKYKCH